MFFLLYGEDTCRSRERLKEIVEQYKMKNRQGLDLFFFDFPEADFDDIEIAVNQRSMFGEKKLIVISNFLNSKMEETEDKMINLLKKIKKERVNLDKENIFFIFFESKVGVQNRLFKFLKKSDETKIQEFKLLKDLELSDWVKTYFSNFGFQVQKDLLKLFLEYVGNDPWRIKNEINKLVNYCQAKKRIEIADIELLVLAEIDNNIFNTIEAIANKNEVKALKLVHNHIQKGDNALGLLSMIAYQFKILLTIRDLIDRSKNYTEIGKELKMHPFVLRKNYQLASFFKTEELKKFYQKILETDLEIKWGLPPALGIEILIIKNS